MDKSPYLCLIPLSDSLLGYGMTPERGGVFELDMLSKTIVNQMEEDTERFVANEQTHYIACSWLVFVVRGLE